MARFPVGADGKYEIPRLTADQLREVYARNPSPEARALLWEIHRLRLLVLRAHQLAESLGGGCAQSTNLVRDCLRRELEGEPCVAERQKWDAEFFGEANSRRYARKLRRKD